MNDITPETSTVGASNTGPNASLHIVGVVGNDIINDNRVKKAAASAAAAGYRSTIVCYTPEAARRVSPMGEVEVVRVPVPFYVRDRRRRVPGPARAFNGAELNGRHLGPRNSQLGLKRRIEARAAAGEKVRLELFVMRVRMWVRRQGFFLRVRGNAQFDRLSRRYFLTRTRLGQRFLSRFRNAVGSALDYEVEFGPELVAQRPDLIHAHDYHMIGVAVSSARILRKMGHPTKVLYDAHELIEGLSYPAEVIEGWLDEEGTHIQEVDAVTGVSAEQVERIAERYGLDQVPKVVMNAPLPVEAVDEGPTLTDEIDADHVLVYHGNVAEERGVFTLVDALHHLGDGVHVAFVAPPDSPVRAQIVEHAAADGLADRVHVLDFVPPERLDRYLSSGSIAVIPYLHTGNNDIALPNKLFESIQAGMPVLASDMRALARYVTETGVGMVFRSGDHVDLAAKASAMLDDLPTFRGAISDDVRAGARWDAQAASLMGVYESLIGRPAEPRRSSSTSVDIKESRPTGHRADFRERRLVVGPRNMAGQAHAVARAVETHLGVAAESHVLDTARFRFPADQYVTRDQWFDPAWQNHQIRLLGATVTHVLAESGTGILGALNGGFIDEQIARLRTDAIEVAVLLHGSEIRDPARHRRQLQFSPYSTHDPLIRDLEEATARLRDHLTSIDVPMFVTTPDLLADVEATWLPVVIDVDEWTMPPPQDHDLPVVLHLPTNGLLKGSDYIDEVLHGLACEGLIRYDRRVEHLDPSEVAAAIEQADIVVDGIVLGAYGVMSCQTLAAGRIAIAGLDQLGELANECPIVNASPATLEERIRDLAAHRESWAPIRDAGQAFVRQYHDGRYTAQSLGDFLGVQP